MSKQGRDLESIKNRKYYSGKKKTILLKPNYLSFRKDIVDVIGRAWSEK